MLNDKVNLPKDELIIKIKKSRKIKGKEKNNEKIQASRR